MESVVATVDEGLKPYKKIFKRQITKDDLLRLLEIKIKRISKFDTFRADEQINSLEEDIEATQKNLKYLTKYAIKWFTDLKKQYGKGRERKTELSSFKKVVAQDVVIANETLYVDKKKALRAQA